MSATTLREKLGMVLRNLIQPENLTNLVAIIVAVLLGYRSIQTGAIEQYFQAVLAVLGLLAIAQLASGYSSVQRDERTKHAADAIVRLEQDLKSRIGADRFLAHRIDFTSLEIALENAKQLDVVGVSLIGLASTHHGLLQQKRESGCRIRLITTNPANKPLADLIAHRLPEAPTKEIHISHAKTAIQALLNISGQSPSGGSVEIKVLDTLPPFGLFIIDGDTKKGQIRVELIPDECPIAERPAFELLASRDGNWYTEFRHQFEILWDKALPVKK